MGVKERREREREELRGEILVAARTIALRDGWNAVTIRKIADVIEYSPPTIYEHFANKESILIALMVEGLHILMEKLRSARDSVADPQAALLAMARAYLVFAWEHPELYQVMHAQGGVPFCDEANQPAEFVEVFEITAEALARLGVADAPSASSMQDAADIMWAMLHGLVSLEMNDLIDGGHTRSLHLAEQAVGAFIRGWNIHE